jgi:hypothetical protein
MNPLRVEGKRLEKELTTSRSRARGCSWKKLHGHVLIHRIYASNTNTNHSNSGSLAPRSSCGNLEHNKDESWHIVCRESFTGVKGSNEK